MKPNVTYTEDIIYVMENGDEDYDADDDNYDDDDDDEEIRWTEFVVSFELCKRALRE